MASRRKRKPKLVKPVERPWPLPKVTPNFACDGQDQFDGTITIRVLLGGIPLKEGHNVAMWLGNLIASRLPKKVQAKTIEVVPERTQ